MVYATVGVRILLASVPSVLIAARDNASAGSGGLAGVAVDVIVVPFFLLALAAVAANRMLLPWVRKSDGLVRMLHLAQTATLVLAYGLPLVATVVFAARPAWMSMLLPLSGALLGLAFVASAGLLGTYTVRTART